MRSLFYLLMTFGLIFTFNSCSSDSDNNSSNSDNTDGNETPLVLKTIGVIDSDGEEFQIKLICEANKLVRIQFPEKRVDYFYDGDFISRKEVFVGESTSTTEYEYDSYSRLIRSYFTNSSNWYIDATIDYNGNMATVNETIGNPDGTTSEQVTEVWFNNGNVIALSSSGDDFNYEFEITYDNKSNFISGIKGLDKLAVVELNLMHCIIGANNAQIMIGVNETNYQKAFIYQYNHQGYPTNVTVEIAVNDGTEYVENYFLEYY